MKKIILCLFVLIVQNGCTHYRSNDMTINETIKSNTFVYKNVSKLEMQEAIAKVFRLAKDDMYTNISANKNSFDAKVQSTIFMVIAYVRIFNNITFDLLEQSSNLEINITHKENVTSNNFAIITDNAESIVTSQALNDLIFKRVDYFLGKTKKWYSCNDYDEYIDLNSIKGNTDPICWFASDIHPESEKGQKY